jgi:hypothetical protein
MEPRVYATTGNNTIRAESSERASEGEDEALRA